MLTQTNLLLLFLSLVVAATGVFMVLRHMRRARLRQRRRRILDELNETDVVDVEIQVAGVDSEYRAARVVRKRGRLSRRGTSFLVAPVGADTAPVKPGENSRIRFSKGGIAHELPCLCTGHKRLSSKGRQQLGVDGTALLLLTPVSVIIKRERRDMMRFYVGEEQRLPRGTTDARSFVDLRAWLLPTDLDVTGERRLRRKMRPDAFQVCRPDGMTMPPAQWATAPQEVGGEVDVIDFSVTGLRIECDVETVFSQQATEAGIDKARAAAIESVADQAWLVTIAVDLQFPPSVQPLEPTVPEWTWMLAEVARISMLEPDEDEAAVESTEGDRMRLGLELLYQPAEIDPVTAVPSRWELLKGHSEADDLVAIHNALNQAAAQMQSEAPTPNRK